MSHETASASLEAVALDALSDIERRAVLDHAESCAECAPALAALRNTVALIGQSAPPVAIDPARRDAMRARLVQRAAADRGDRSTASTDPPKVASARSASAVARRRWNPWQVLAVAASIAFVASAALLYSVQRERATLRESLAAAAAHSAVLRQRSDSLSAALDADRRLVDAVTGAQVRVVELTANGVSAPRARMFWNQATNRWTMAAHNLPALAAGRTYQLWLVSGGSKISAGTFAPSKSGDAVVSAEYALAPDALQAIAVTEEPSGGVPQPTGSMVLVGGAK
jgi:hypothetical protein